MLTVTLVLTTKLFVDVHLVYDVSLVRRRILVSTYPRVDDILVSTISSCRRYPRVDDILGTTYPRVDVRVLRRTPRYVDANSVTSYPRGHRNLAST